MAFDLESIMKEIQNRLIDPDIGINQRIAAINLEKAPTDVLMYGQLAAINQILNGDIYFLTGYQVTANTNQFIIITTEHMDTDNMGKFELGIEIRIVFTADNDLLCNVKALRYMRALRQTLEYNRFAGLPSQAQRIRQIKPIGFLTEDNRSWREVGCIVDTEFLIW